MGVGLIVDDVHLLSFAGWTDRCHLQAWLVNLLPDLTDGVLYVSPLSSGGAWW